ncbi:MAG TPA: winged helix-turn-helix transcriptional regulator [Mesoaciditoga lauensis]|nr:winged helix-turn-helix transcriptional regulator [Mesoaciditoga lauensis]
MDIQEIINILATGENEKVEFKEKVSERTIESLCAFANTFGGTMIIGVSDKGKIKGVIDAKDQIRKISDYANSVVPPIAIEISEFKIEKLTIIIVKVRKSNAFHSFKNIVYMRVGNNNRPISPFELLSLANESLLVPFDSSVSKLTIKDVDTERLKYFEKMRFESRGIEPTKKSVDEFFIQENLLDPLTKRLKAVSVLFFVKNPQIHYPNSKVEIMEFKDESMNQILNREIVLGTIPEIAERTLDILKSKNKTIEVLVPGKIRRISVKSYPDGALREAVLNALIHRNYYDPSYIQIFVFPNHILVKNPGAFPYGVTPEKPIHKPRNPEISRLMFEMGYVEKYGSGIKRIKSEIEKHGFSSFEYTEYISYTEIKISKKYDQLFDDTDKRIIALLDIEHSSSEIAKKLNISIPTVVKHLNNLVKIGIVQKIGTAKNTKYKI